MKKRGNLNRQKNFGQIEIFIFLNPILVSQTEQKVYDLSQQLPHNDTEYLNTAERASQTTLRPTIYLL